MVHRLERPSDWADACCEVCPAQRLGPGGFDVAEPPFPGQAFVDGVRVIAALGTPICIHPWRVGLPPGRYASQGEPFPVQPGRRPDGCLMRQPDSGEHLYRVGLPVGVYASAGVPVPDDTVVPEPTAEALELPDLLEDLEGWLVARLRIAESDQIFTAVGRAERQALQRFPSRDVVRAMRKVLSYELARR